MMPTDAEILDIWALVAEHALIHAAVLGGVEVPAPNPPLPMCIPDEEVIRMIAVLQERRRKREAAR